MGFFTSTVNAIQATVDLLGRDVVLRQQTGTALTDAAKPWLGTSENFTETTVKAVFEPFKMKEMDETIVISGDVKVYMASGALGSVEPSVGDIVIDGTLEYRLQRVLHFKPNEDSIAFELHARRC